MAFSLSAATVHPTQLSPQAEGWRGGSDRVRWEPWEVVLCFCIFFISLSYITSTRSKGTFAHWSKAAGTPCKTKQNGKKQTTLFQVFPYIPSSRLGTFWLRIRRRPTVGLGPGADYTATFSLHRPSASPNAKKGQLEHFPQTLFHRIRIGLGNGLNQKGISVVFSMQAK